jgi:hypothetical protein
VAPQEKPTSDCEAIRRAANDVHCAILKRERAGTLQRTTRKECRFQRFHIGPLSMLQGNWHGLCLSLDAVQVTMLVSHIPTKPRGRSALCEDGPQHARPATKGEAVLHNTPIGRRTESHVPGGGERDAEAMILQVFCEGAKGCCSWQGAGQSLGSSSRLHGKISQELDRAGGVKGIPQGEPRGGTDQRLTVSS